MVELPWECALSYETLLKHLYFDRYCGPFVTEKHGLQHVAVFQYIFMYTASTEVKL